MRYAQQKALVVGASGGIGAAIARELVLNGCEATLTFRSTRSALEPIQLEASAAGGVCEIAQLDLSEPQSIEPFIEQLVETFGCPTIVVTSAGILRDQPISKISDEDWNATLDVNLTGTFRLLRALFPHMRRKGGRIVNVASVSGLFGIQGQAAYAASKGGLIAMTRSLAREFGPFGITVNALAPGYVETEMTEDLSDRRRRQVFAQIPMRRFAQPGDLVSSARLLMAPDGTYVTGQVLVVDGGLTC